jgi:carbamoyltransferase
MDLKPDGTFRLNMDFFDYCTGLTMTNRRFDKLFGGPPRREGKPLEQRHMDLAASAQAVTEDVMLRLTRSLAAEFGLPNLCLAGGVALNCVANGKVVRDGAFENVWVQPAAGDAGGALGAALIATHLHHGRPREVAAGKRDAMGGSYLGPAFGNEEIAGRLTAAGARFTALPEDALLERTIDALEEGCAVGWFQGRMEFGPRALGGRSILGDPRSPEMQRTLNLRVKYRESSGPSPRRCCAKTSPDWFELDADSPYMLLVADVVTGVRRAMTAEEEALFGIDKLNVPRSSSRRSRTSTTPRAYRRCTPTPIRVSRGDLRFKARTGCPVLVNTSFNVRGEPLVCTPEDAFRCFMGTGIDVLVAGHCLLLKSDQDPA